LTNRLQYAIIRIMSFHKSSEIAVAPRPWLSRQPGECAFPVDGCGQSMRSCCNPCGGAIYCPAHRRIATVRTTAPIDLVLKELLDLGLCG